MFRKIGFGDWGLLLGWRNDESVRENSINTELIDEETHKSYIKNLIKREDRNQFLYFVAGQPVGYIREDELDGCKELSYLISPSHQGKGYGKKMMKQFLSSRSGRFILHIKDHNIPSVKMAVANGFTEVETHDNYIKYELTKMTDLEIIDAVEEARKGNNVNWMNLVRLAFEVAPERARPIFAKINGGDGEISKLLDKLAQNG